LEAADEREPRDVFLPVHAEPTPTMGWRQEAQRLVLADRADRQPRSSRQTVDGELSIASRLSHSLDTTGDNRYGKCRNHRR
jgi:hypothetical protein